MGVKKNFSPFFLGHLLRIVLNVSKNFPLSLKCMYSWPLNNADLNCVGALYKQTFSLVNTTELQDPGLIESIDVQLYV